MQNSFFSNYPEKKPLTVTITSDEIMPNHKGDEEFKLAYG